MKRNRKDSVDSFDELEQKFEKESQKNERLEQYVRKRQLMTITPFIIDSLNPDLTFDSKWMVPLDENYEELKKGIIG